LTVDVKTPPATGHRRTRDQYTALQYTPREPSITTHEYG